MEIFCDLNNLYYFCTRIGEQNGKLFLKMKTLPKEMNDTVFQNGKLHQLKKKKNYWNFSIIVNE